MSYALRDYQQQASDAAVRFFSDTKSKKNAVIVLPTGSGKSLVIADIAARLEGHTLIFQPSKEILEQNYKKLCSYGVWDCAVYSASLNRKDVSRITFATIGSAKSHPELFRHFRHVIIDECHLVNPKEGMYRDFLAALGSKVLGLTATPYRLTASSLGAMPSSSPAPARRCSPKSSTTCRWPPCSTWATSPGWNTTSSCPRAGTAGG